MNTILADERLTAARAGDQQAFSDVVETYRADLLVHCYRLLASPQDAEDMVQETFLRAWNKLDSFTGGPYFRAWLYKIATNICLDALDKRSRRVLSPANYPASDPRSSIQAPINEPIWLEPFPDEQLAEVAPGPEARYTQRESISLAFLAALQFLPPRQRVILILCDVLDWRAKEVAQLLDITLASVNGLLRRARATMQGRYGQKEAALAIDHHIRRALDQYIEAWETADVDKLVALLADQVTLTMPPSPTWFMGRADVRAHTERMFSNRAYQNWRLLPTHANQQVAFACYRLETSDGRFHTHSLHLLTLENGRISEIDMFFLPLIFPRFGLALEL